MNELNDLRKTLRIKTSDLCNLIVEADDLCRDSDGCPTAEEWQSIANLARELAPPLNDGPNPFKAIQTTETTPTKQAIDAIESALADLHASGYQGSAKFKIRIGLGILSVDMKTEGFEDDDEEQLCEGCGVLPGEPLCEVCDGSLTGGADNV